MKTPRRLTPLCAVVLAAGVLAGCGDGEPNPAAPASAGTGQELPAARLSLVAYSTPQSAYEKVIKAFNRTPEGRRISFTQSYGASGDQSRAVESGLEADIVAFSLEPDMTRLVRANMVAATWNADEYRGMVTNSVVVFGTRKGNPEKISSWEDLVEPGVEVITPNPFASGGARWNVLAAYGAKSDVGRDESAGLAYLAQLFDHVPVQDDTARKSLQTFITGKGDAILAYENEAIFAQQRDQPLDYSVPDQTILIENPVAVTANSKHPQQAAAFLRFLRSETAQRIFADEGYRPVLREVTREGEFRTPAKVFTIGDLGGWEQLNKRFFDPRTGLLLDIERQRGVPTGR